MIFAGEAHRRGAQGDEPVERRTRGKTHTEVSERVELPRGANWEDPRENPWTRETCNRGAREGQAAQSKFK